MKNFKDLHKYKYSVHVHLYVLFLSYLYQFGETVLYVAAKNNHTDIALLLIKCRCSVDVKNNVSLFRLLYQLEKPLQVVVHIFTYYSVVQQASLSLAYGQISHPYQHTDGHKKIQKQTRPTCILKMWNLGEQTCPKTIAVN